MNSPFLLNVEILPFIVNMVKINQNASRDSLFFTKNEKQISKFKSVFHFPLFFLCDANFKYFSNLSQLIQNDVQFNIKIDKIEAGIYIFFFFFTNMIMFQFCIINTSEQYSLPYLVAEFIRRM